MDIVTIDFETYYSKEYSLSKLTTEEYVRSDDFEVIGVGVKVNDNPADWYSGSDVRTFLNSLDYSDKAILCHNTVFDGAILSWHYDIKPKFWFDTMSMARPNHNVTVGGSLKNLALYFKLGEKGTEVLDALGKRRKDFTPTELHKYGSYCVNDIELTYKLFRKLKKDFPVSELLVIDQTIRMYTEPVIELDRFKLCDHLKAEQERKQKLLNKLGNGDPEAARAVLSSNPKFAALLENLGAVVPMKVSPRTGKDTYAFAKTDPGLPCNPCCN
jgi:DNA polymerase